MWVQWCTLARQPATSFIVLNHPASCYLALAADSPAVHTFPRSVICASPADKDFCVYVTDHSSVY